MIKQYSIILLLLILSLLACEKWNLEPTFVALRPIATTVLSTSSVALDAQVDFDALQVDDHGFIWALGDIEPDVLINNGRITKGVKKKEQGAFFSDTLKNLLPGELYSIRAYTELNNQLFFSDTIQYTTDGGRVITEAPQYAFGTNISLRGRITGTDAGIYAVSHGFCWSTTNTMPSEMDNCIELGVWRSDDIFTYDFTNLINGQTLYIRAFARLQVNLEQKFVYGTPITFNGDLRDIWSQMPDTIPLSRENAVSFSLNGLGYVGTGSKKNAQGIEEYLNDFWSFNPQTKEWTKVASLPAAARIDAVAFAIEEQGLGYVVAGQPKDGFPLDDCWAYDPDCNCWLEKASFKGGRRSGALGVSIDGKAYVGTGRNTFSISQSDWWEYDPADATETDQQGRPLGKWTLQNLKPPPRVEGVAFALRGKAYVGIGEAGTGSNDDLADFWEFTPNNAGGSWRELNNFTGISRVQALAISVQEEYVFLGLGSNQRSIIYDDWWTYLPDIDKWERRSDFPGQGKKGAIGFTIDNSAFVGTGTDLDISFSTFWEYDAQ